MKSYLAYQIDWLELESGWGQRSSGSTLHRSKQVADEYIDGYWKRTKERYGSSLPDEYLKPGEPYQVEIDEAIIIHLEKVGSFWISTREHWDGDCSIFKIE
jgi:hypothetical protein